MVENQDNISIPNPAYPIYDDSVSSIYPRQDDRGRDDVGIIKALSPIKVIKQIRMNLMGYFFDPEKEEYIKMTEPLMNDYGISKYISVVSSVASDIVTFSNYLPEDVNPLTQFVIESAIPSIYVNYKEFGIKNKSDLPIVSMMIFNITLASFKKAVGAGDRNVIRKSYTEGYMTSAAEGQRPKKEGFFSKLNPFS